MINDAESDVEQDIPVLRKELETKKADGVSATQMVSPFYKAALKGKLMGSETQCAEIRTFQPGNILCCCLYGFRKSDFAGTIFDLYE